MLDRPRPPATTLRASLSGILYKSGSATHIQSRNQTERKKKREIFIWNMIRARSLIFKAVCGVVICGRGLEFQSIPGICSFQARTVFSAFECNHTSTCFQAKDTAIWLRIDSPEVNHRSWALSWRIELQHCGNLVCSMWQERNVLGTGSLFNDVVVYTEWIEWINFTAIQSQLMDRCKGRTQRCSRCRLSAQNVSII